MWNKKSWFAGLRLLFAVHCGITVPVSGAQMFAASIEPPAFGAGMVAARRGALFRVMRGGEVSYLFGTLHVGTDAFYPLAPEVSRALADSSALVVELDTRANGAYQLAVDKYGSYRAGDSIRTHVSADTLVRLTHALHAAGIPLRDVAQRKPWFLANLLAGLELARSGYQRGEGIDAFLLTSAQERGTAVSELESADYQLSLFDTLDDAHAEGYLRERLGELADGSSLKKAQAFIAAWCSGDATSVDALLRDTTAGDTIVAAFTRHTLLDRRNPDMAAHIIRIMRDNKVTFVGVGLLHLLGANGLPQLLFRQGYQVERIY